MKNKFKIGDFVKVKKGLKEPDYDSILMDNWEGEIIEIEKNRLNILLDSKTIANLPVDYLVRINKDGAEPEEICLDVSDVEPTSERDCTEAEDRRASSKLYWTSLFEDTADEYLNYFNTVDVDDEDDMGSTWADYLTDKLEFPLEVEVTESSGDLRDGDKLKFLDIDFFDDKYGILGTCKGKRGAITYPICNLEVIDKTSKSYQPLQDYCIWFANR